MLCRVIRKGLQCVHPPVRKPRRQPRKLWTRREPHHRFSRREILAIFNIHAKASFTFSAAANRGFAYGAMGYGFSVPHGPFFGATEVKTTFSVYLKTI